jgi:hypothetical protein
MKDENQQHGGNNGGENSGISTNGESDNNNNGQADPLAAFWNDPEPKPNQQNANGNGDGNQNQQPKNPVAQAIQTQLSGFKVSDVMTPDIMAKLGEGDMAGFNESINGAVRGAVEKSVGMSIQVMQAFGESIFAKVESMIESSQNSTKNNDFLEQSFPSAKNPTIRPVIQSLYDRALTVASGDREKAISLTKQMMKTMAGETAGDIGLNIAPIGPDSEPARPKVNWLENLMGSN